MAERFFIKRSSEWGALFHYFPQAVYEFRDHIWRVRELQGDVPRNLFNSDAFQRLQDELSRLNVNFRSISSPKRGSSEIFPMSWVCSSCGLFKDGELRDRNCPVCGGEMRQFPFVVLCDSCGYLNRVTTSRCPRCNDTSMLGIVWYDRSNLLNIHMICKRCQDEVLRRAGINCDRRCMQCSIRNKPCQRYHKEFSVFSELEITANCPRCGNRPGKRIVPATISTLVSPKFINTFDQDIPTIIDNAITSARREMEAYPDADLSYVFDRIHRVFGIEDIYLAEIVALTCTYGYQVGRCERTFNFPGGTVYVKAENVTAAVFKFDPEMLPIENRHAVLHAAAHAFIQTAGYITGLGNAAYREYVDDENNVVMIFSIESGGCDVLIREPYKLINWLRRARGIVRGCKNQCSTGCPWCLHIRNWQCMEFNKNLDRRGLNQMWRERFLIQEVER